MTPTLDEIRLLPDFILSGVEDEIQRDDLPELVLKPQFISSFRFETVVAEGMLPDVDVRRLDLVTSRVRLLRRPLRPVVMVLHCLETEDLNTARIIRDARKFEKHPLTIIPLAITGERLDPIISGDFETYSIGTNVDAAEARPFNWVWTLMGIDAED